MSDPTTQQSEPSTESTVAVAPEVGETTDAVDDVVITPVAGTPVWPATTPAAPQLEVPVSLGLVGKHRMPAVVIVLSLVTFGLYSLIWHARINREVSDFDTRMHVAIGRTTWALVIPWLAGVATSAAGVLLLLAPQLGITPPAGITATPLGYILVAGLFVVPWLELLLPFSLVAIAMTAERVRICQDRIGLTRDVQLRPAAAVAWLLVPLIGRLVLMAKLQNSLNGVWERVAPPASHRSR